MKYKIKPEDIRVFDIYAKDRREVFLAGTFGPEGVFIFETVADLIDYIGRTGGVWFAHEGAQFEFLIILPELLQGSWTIKDSCLSANKMIVFEIEKDGAKVQFRDSFAVFRSAQREIENSFLGYEIDRIDKRIIDQYELKALAESCLRECESLYNIILSSEKYFGFMPGVSIGATAVKSLKKINTEALGYNWHGAKMKWPARHYSEIKDSIYGGRTEVFERFGEGLWEYDVNSMYPAVMGGWFPGGLKIYTNKYKEKYFGIYNCFVNYPEDDPFPCLPMRGKDSGNLVFPVGRWSAMYTSDEIHYARQRGVDVEVIDGYYYTDKVKPFDRFVKYWYDKKRDSKSEAERTVAKLMLNSLYGKFCQGTTIKILYQGKVDMEMVRKKNVVPIAREFDLYSIEEDTYKRTSAPVGSFILSRARIKLHRLINRIIELGGRVYYCSTDMVITDIEIPNDMISNELGFLKKKYVGTGYFLAPNYYATEPDEYRGGELSVRSSGLQGVEVEMIKKAVLEDDYSAVQGHVLCLAGIMSKSDWINKVGHRVLNSKIIERFAVKREVRGWSTSPIVVH